MRLRSFYLDRKGEASEISVLGGGGAALGGSLVLGLVMGIANVGGLRPISAFRLLAGSSESSQGASSWRTLWQEIVRKPSNVLGPIKALDATQSGFLKTYGLLSHIVHGTVCTGGDLLGTRGRVEAHQPTLAQLILFLANLCEFNAMLDRQAGSMTIEHRLDVIRRNPTAFGERIKGMRLLEGQKLKPGRDIFGSGTHADPFRFRDGLLYHEAFYHYLKQEGSKCAIAGWNSSPPASEIASKPTTAAYSTS